MTDSTQSNLPDPDPALTTRVIARAQAITGALIDRLRIVEGDLATGNHLAALGGLDGVERDFATVRSFLLLLA